MKFLVAQLGARMHYAVPRMMNEAGMLGQFYTDICAVKGWPRLLNIVPRVVQPAGLKRLLGRVPKGVPHKQITAFTQFGWEYQRRYATALSPAEKTQTNLWAGRRFCELVLANGFHDADAVYTFNSAGLELLIAARERGLRAVMEQTIAPMEIERALLEDEYQRFSDWEAPPTADTARQEFIARERAEWAQADLILCGSEFVRMSIAAAGGPVEKCCVVPYGVNAPSSAPPKKRYERPLRVLTVGGVGLRKGSPYVQQAAATLTGKAVFRMVGNVAVTPSARALLESTLELTGVVPRAEMQKHFAWADVFLLPSLCEGSATVVYEAMAAGLAVICTPNTGSVVRDGVDGYIVPIRDTDAITQAVLALAKAPDLLAAMSANARERAKDYDLLRYQERLVAALNGPLIPPKGGPWVSLVS